MKQGFTDPQFGSQTYRFAHSLQERTTAVSDGSGVFENGLYGDAQTAFILPRISRRSGTALRTDCRTGASTGTGADAPRAWWERVETDMNKLKWRTLTSVTDQIEGLAVAYVDDCNHAIHEESLVDQRHFSDVKALYEWGAWESGSFTQCGVQIVQHRHQNRWAVFSPSCARYAESMVLLDLSSARRKQREDLVTAKELAGLRGLLGQCMWLADPGGTTAPSSFVNALGIFGSGHCFNTPGSKQTCKTSIGSGSNSSSHLCS